MVKGVPSESGGPHGELVRDSGDRSSHRTWSLALRRRVI